MSQPGGGAQFETPTYSLAEAFSIRLPSAVGCIHVDSFTGDPASTVLRFDDPESSSHEVQLRHRKRWNFDSSVFPEGVTVWVVNLAAQAGLELRISYGLPGSVIEGGDLVVSLEDSTGTAINPATEDKQDALAVLVGEVDAAPTANTLLARLKKIGDLVGKAWGSLETYIHTVATGTSTAITNAGASKPVGQGGVVTVKALSTNTVSVFIGASGVAVADGFELLAGEAVTLAVSDVNLIFAISGTASQKVCWIIEEAA